MPPEMASALESAKEELHPLLEHAKDALEAIGQKLLLLRDDESVGSSGVGVLIRWLADQTGIAQASFIVWYRIASGDLPKAVKDTKCCDSTLQHMNEATAKELIEGKPRSIHDRMSGGTKLIRPREFTREDHSMYTRATYILAQPEGLKTPAQRRFHASSARWENNGKTLIVTVEREHLDIIVPLAKIQPLEKKDVA